MRVLAIALLVFLGCAPQPFREEPKDTELPKKITNSIGMKLVLCPKGTFMMGSPSDEADRQYNEQQHEVTLSKDFYLGVCEVTQDEWKSLMKTELWKGQEFVREEGGDYPATYVSYDDAVSFCEKLSAKEGREYRLPTEAEWEYACRAGTTTAFSFGDSKDELTKYAWFDGNILHQVGANLPNPWGLYDMHGNVWEWCQDWHGAYPSVAVTDPQGPPEGSDRVSRGGSWLGHGGRAAHCRAAGRGRDSPDHRDAALGFRVALVPSVKQPEAKESK